MSKPGISGLYESIDITIVRAGATGNEPAIISFGRCVSPYTTPKYGANYTTAFTIRQIISQLVLAGQQVSCPLPMPVRYD